MVLFDTEILALAAGLPIGATRHGLCPDCQGGARGEQSVSVTQQAGRVAWKCHRASCGAHGYVGGDALPATGVLPAPHEPYTGSICALDTPTIEALHQRYGISDTAIERYIKSAGDGWYALPINDAMQHPRGWVIRTPWGQTPKTVKTFLDKADAVSLAWYGRGSSGAVLVEDSLSALRLADRYDVTAVALLGTNLSAVKVSELQRHTRNVVLALDADATEAAFKLASLWAPAFRSFRVAVLAQDVKDMSADDLDELADTQGLT